MTRVPYGTYSYSPYRDRVIYRNGEPFARLTPHTLDPQALDALAPVAANGPNLLHFCRVLLDYTDRLPADQRPDASWSAPIRALLAELEN